MPKPKTGARRKQRTSRRSKTPPRVTPRSAPKPSRTTALSPRAAGGPLTADERAEFQDNWNRAKRGCEWLEPDPPETARRCFEQDREQVIDAILHREARRKYWANRPSPDELLLEQLRCLDWHEQPYEHRLQPIEPLPLIKSQIDSYTDEEYSEWREYCRRMQMACGSAKQGATPSDIDEWLTAVWPGISPEDLEVAHDLAVNVSVPLAYLDTSHPADLSDENAHHFDVRVWRLTTEGRRYLRDHDTKADVATRADIALAMPAAPALPQQPQSQPSDSTEATMVAESEEVNTPRAKRSPSRLKAAAVYDWAIKNIPGADEMTVQQLFDAIREHPDMQDHWLAQRPSNAETFGKYLRDAGIKRYNSTGERVRRISHFRRCDEA